MEGEENKKKLSFGFCLADDQKIKLIDILTEDDHFLVASPFCDSIEDSFSDREHVGFRLSGFKNCPEVEIFQQKDQNQFPSDFAKLRKPSFHRRSLAWDSAFFNSPGVLDPDELSCINKGLRATEAHSLTCTQDVRKRRSVSDSTRNGDGFPADWFEIEPSIYKPKSRKMSNVAGKSPKSGLKQEKGLQNVQVLLKKADKSFINKMKPNQTSTGKSINKMESTPIRKQGTTSSPKPPKALDRKFSTRSNHNDLTGKSIVKMENKCSSTHSGKYLKRKTESRKNQLFASLSTSNIWRHAEKSTKGMGNIISLSTRSLSCRSPESPAGRWSSKSLSSSLGKHKQTSEGSNIGLDIKNRIAKAANFQSPLSFSEQSGTCSVGSAKGLRPSELRPPSPQIGFFDEKTPPRYHGITRTRKMPQKFSSEGSLRTNTQFDHSNIELSPVDSSNSSRYTSACKKLKTQENGKRNSSRSDQVQIGNLSRYFAAIDLNQEKSTESKRKQTDWNDTARTPLADKTFSYNSVGTLAVLKETEKEKLVSQKASLVCTKENS